MEVKMKVAFLCCILFLAGCASAGSVEAKTIDLPDWFPDIVIPDWILELVANIPDSIQGIIDRLPEIIEAVPGILENIREVIIEIIVRLPALIEEFINNLPQIIAQVPALVDRLRVIINTIVERIPALITRILEVLPQVIEAVPGAAAQIKEIYDNIRDFLELNGWLPDWLPTLPNHLPEWWPPQIPEAPEFNVATPGVRATVTEFPGIVQIEIGAGPIWVQGCVGSVMTSRHVLTTASCVIGGNNILRYRRVRAGSSTRYGDGQVSSVANALSHPDYSPFSSTADLALLYLNTNFVLGANVAQTAIITQDFNLPSFIGVTLAGWGSTAEGKFAADLDLYKFEAVTVDQATCAERWAAVPFFKFPSNSLCIGDAKYVGRNGDLRDLGAPIYYDRILVGIVSWSAPVGNHYFPVITTNIAQFTNWIVSNSV